MPPERLRIASVQYYIRPVKSFDDFAEQMCGLAATAADYKAQLMVLPEYFTLQLLTLQDLSQPLIQQIRSLAKQGPDYLKLMSELAQEHSMYICGGSIPFYEEDTGCLYNQSYLFAPSGEYDFQGKLHLTRWEAEDWQVCKRDRLRIFNTEIGKLAIAICYDVEFPELARAAARAGCYMLLVPSCTDERQGFLRVRYCAHARAIENQMYCIHACTVGSLPSIPAVSLNYGSAAILTPSDFAFSRDGILAEGNINQEMMIVGDVNLRVIEESRQDGTVLPLRDSVTTEQVLSAMEEVRL